MKEGERDILRGAGNKSDGDRRKRERVGREERENGGEKMKARGESVISNDDEKANETWF